MPTDSLFGDQGYLRATGDWTVDISITDVWDEYRGSGVVVGIVDDGVEWTHPDLRANYDTSLDYDAVDGEDDARHDADDEGHGTAVAGIIAADDNGSGAVGVAPDATITGFRIGFDADSPLSEIVDVFQRQVDVDISNNSWGFGYPLYDDFSAPEFEAIGDAIENAAVNGRDGLGTIWVFAAGNGDQIGDRTDYHNLTNSRYTIAVGALDQDGSHNLHSSPGGSLLLSAPSSSGDFGAQTTTDRTSGGYSNTQYTDDFGFSSGAAPIVSGVVALMLEANPDLGYRDVQEILAYSAQHGSVAYSGADGTIRENLAEDWNGGGLVFDQRVGFGNVDAHAAVRLAESWELQSTSVNESSFSASNDHRDQIRDNQNTVSEVSIVGTGMEVQWAEVTVDIEHTWIGDLSIRLIHDDGSSNSVSYVMNLPGRVAGDGGLPDDDVNFTFGVAAHWGELADGDWRLQVRDHAYGDQGALDSWSLTLYGNRPTDNDDYIYTDAYALIADDDAGRRVLADDAGRDRINAAALSDDARINLNAGEAGEIAGLDFQIAEGTIIEDVFSGDGDDTLSGNGFANLMVGARGNDQISGGGGDDRLHGGAGNDTLSGGGGADQFAFEAGFGADLIIDFQVGVDLIDFSALQIGFTDLTFSGEQITAGTFGTVNISGIQVADIGESGFAFEPLPWNPPSTDFEALDDLALRPQEVEDDAVPLPQGAIAGDALANAIAGGLSDDFIDGRHGQDTLEGGVGHDTIVGGHDRDLIDGGEGDDFAFGRGGNDSIDGGDGKDTLFGGSGSDLLNGGEGADVLYGGSGRDTLMGNAGADSLYGGTGVDIFAMRDGGSTVMDFEDGLDQIAIYNRNGRSIWQREYFGHLDIQGIDNGVRVVLSGEFWIDIAGVTTDQIDALDFADLSWANGPDVIATGDSGEVLVGLAGYERLFGGAGNDTIFGGVEGQDTAFGGAGDDVVDFRQSDETVIFGGAGDDSLTGGHDGSELFGGAGRDTLVGLQRDDYLAPGTGGGEIYGGSGADTLDFSFAESVVLDTLAGTAVADGELYTFEGVERFILPGQSRTAPPPEIVGGAGDDLIELARGQTLASGLEGDDTLVANSGNDVLTGGAGSDVFVFQQHGSIDRITDFESGVDRIDLTALGVAFDDLLFGFGEGQAVVQFGERALVHLDGIVEGEMAASDFLLDPVTAPDPEPEVIPEAPPGVTVLELAGSSHIHLSDDGDFAVHDGSDGQISPAGGDDTIYGQGGDDNIHTYGGNNQFFGGEGNDTLSGWSGNDTLFGGAGNDGVYGGNGEDLLYGGAGDDTFRSAALGPSSIYGGDGEDEIQAFGLGNTLYGGAGSDMFWLDRGGSTIMDFEIGVDFIRANSSPVLFDERLRFYEIDGGSRIWINSSEYLDLIGVSIDEARRIPIEGPDVLVHLPVGGTNGDDDRLFGGYGAETIVGGDGADTIRDYNSTRSDIGADLIFGGNGDDDIHLGGMNGKYFDADSGRDTVFGGAGDDTIFMESGGRPHLYGDAGNDHIEAVYGVFQIMYGGEGADTLIGADYGNSLFGGAGVDVLRGGTRNDWLAPGRGGGEVHGGAGTRDRADFLFAENLTVDLAANRVIADGEIYVVTGVEEIIGRNEGTAGNDVMNARRDFGDHVYGLDGADSITGNFQRDELFGGAGNDTLVASYWADDLYGGAGDDVLRANQGDGISIIDGGAGFDVADFSNVPVAFYLPHLNRVVSTHTTFELSGIESVTGVGTGYSPGNDVIVGFGTDDTIDALSGDDHVDGGHNDDSLLGNTGDDTLLGGHGEDTLLGGAGADSLSGGTENDELFGGEGNDRLQGDVGDDTLSGDDGDDLLLGGDGFDDLFGGSGNDTLDPGGGGGLIDGGAGHDVADFTFAARAVFHADHRLVVADGAAYRLLGIEEMLGVTSAASSGDDLVTGSASADSLYGEVGNDTLDGGDGNDRIGGGRGEDSLSGGAGDDTIYGGEDADSLFGGAGDDLLKPGAGGGLIDGGAGNDTADFRFAGAAEFADDSSTVIADGFVYQVDGIENFLGVELPITASADVVDGTDGDDTIDALGGDDLVDGGAGNDSLLGNQGNDTLTGGAGVDSLFGGAGDDVLNPGLGGGLIDGGEGVDTADFSFADDAVFDPLAGQVTSGAQVWRVEGIENLSGVRIAIDENGNDITGTEAGEVIDALGGDDTVDGLGGADTIAGNTGNDLVDGGPGDDELLGNAGDDSLSGGEGDDTLTGGAGNDSITGGAGSDLAVFSGALGNFAIASVAGGGFIVTDTVGGEGADTVGADVELVRFGSWTGRLESAGDGSNRLVLGGGGNETLGGEDGNDSLWAGDGDDWLSGGAGNDTLNGGAGADTADYGALAGGHFINLITGAGADGDQLYSIENINAAAGNDTIYGGFDSNHVMGNDGWDYVLGRGGDDMLEGGAGRDSLLGQDDNDTIYGGADVDMLRGDNGDDSLIGGAILDFIYGGAGNDSLFGGDGNDRMQGGEGNDLLDGDLHNDQMSGEGGADTLFGGDGYDRLDGGDGDDLLDGGAGGGFLFGGTGNDTVQGGDGLDRMFGGDGADLMNGAGGNDYLRGGLGDDTLDGGAGGGWFNGEAGDDVITGGEGIDVIEGGAGADSIDGQAGNDRIYSGSENDTVQGGAGNDRIDAGEGNDVADGGAGNDAMLGRDGDDTLSGGAGVDSIYGQSGNDLLDGGGDADRIDAGTGDDRIIGGDGNDILLARDGADTASGGAGDDRMWGGAGDDVMDGGADNDSLYGDAGADTLLGGTGDDFLHGRDEDDSLDGGSGADRLYGGDGADVLVGRAGDDLISGDHGNDRAYGGDGADTLSGSNGDDWLVGDNGDDLLQGGAGNDLLDGRADNDRIEGSFGADYMLGRDGDDTLDGGRDADTLEGGAGNDLLTGGGGADEFRFFSADGTGTDTVTDFEAGVDSFRLYSLTIGSVADTDADGLDGNDATLVTFSNGATVTLLGLTGLDETDLF